MEWWVSFFVQIFCCRVVLTGVRTHVVATTVCATGCVHTLTCCTHIYLVYIQCAYTSHIVMRATHAWLKGVCSAHVVISLSSHLLPSHVSPVLAPAVLWRSLRDHSRQRPRWLWRPRLPAELSRPKSAGRAHSARGRGVWLPGRFHALHRLWVQKVRQEYFRGWWQGAHQRSGPQYPRLLENQEREHGQFGVHTVFESSVLHVSHWWFLFLRQKAKKACNRETVAWQWMSPKFLNNWKNHQNLVEHVDDQRRFQECSYSLVYFAAFQLRG